MGCICSKGTRADQFVNKNHLKKRFSRKGKKVSASQENDNVEPCGDGNEMSAAVAEAFTTAAQPGSSKAAFASPRALSWDREEKAAALGVEKYDVGSHSLQRRPTMEFGTRSINSQPRMGRLNGVANGERGAQVIAGWPSWLAAVAGEAINGWVPRKADSFEKLEKIGQGTYSSVYKARDLETNRIVALKKVRFTNMDPESVRFMAREIIILRRLNHPNVMKLEGIITSRTSASIYLIFDYMEHDLAGLASTYGIKFTESQIKCYMQQLLLGLEHCHSRGVLHRDIKGSNLLIDHRGNLKIADFGLATFFLSQQKQQQPLTSRVVTLWYRPPELLLGATDYGEAVDLWSSGCILAELFAGKPIMPGRTEVEQLHKIFKLCGSPSEEYWKKSKLPHATIFKPQNPYKRCVAQSYMDFPASVLALLDTLLAIEPESRGSTSSAVRSQFFTTAPLPCDPSCLPKYPPSKEFDGKFREDEAKRKKLGGGKGRGYESLRNVSREPKPKPASDAKSEFQGSIQSRELSNCNTEEDSGAGFVIKPQKGQSEHLHSHKTSTGADVSPRKLAELRAQALNMQQGATELPRSSNSVAVRGSSQFNMSKGSSLNPHCPEARFTSSGCSNLDVSELSGKHGQSSHLLFPPLKDEQQLSSKESSTFPNNSRMHYSGPLMPPGGNLDEMLKEHEKRIQEAVRKARGDKAKTGSNSSLNGLCESVPNEMTSR